MFRRIVRAAALASVLGVLVASWSPASIQAAGGMATSCYNDTTGWLVPIGYHASNYFAWKDADGANRHKYGIEGSFPAFGHYSGLDACSGLGYGNVSSASMWVALEEGTSILQVGLIRAQGFGCDNGMKCDGQIHMFWTWGNCSGWGCDGPNGRGPEMIDLGLWEGKTMAFGIESSPGPNGTVWIPEINGLIVIDPGWLPRTVANTPFLGGTEVRASWVCETWDRGDACGGSSSNRYSIGSMVVQETAGGPWVRNPVHANACDYAWSGTGWAYHCLSTSNSSMDFWTTR
jgi:hypothetical protein